MTTPAPGGGAGTPERAAPFGGPPALGSARGVVEAFDAEVGLGTIVDGAGARWPFHCTAIANGSRTIEVGVEVHFVRAPGGPGRWEAHSVSP